MQPAKRHVVTINSSGVGTLHGIVIGREGLGGLAEVTVDAAEEVMGFHLLIGGAVAVVIVNDVDHHGVGGEGDVCLVAGLGLKQAVAHLLGLRPCRHLGLATIKNLQRRVRPVGHKTVGTGQQGCGPGIVTTTTEQQAGYQQHCQGKQTHQLLHGCKGNEALYGL